MKNGLVWQRHRTAPLPATNQASPGRKSDGGNRLFLEVILFVIRTGIPWRDIPRAYGHWNSIYKWFARWAEDGVWQRVFGILTEGKLDMGEASIDSTVAGRPNTQPEHVLGDKAYAQQSFRQLDPRGRHLPLDWQLTR